MLFFCKAVRCIVAGVITQIRSSWGVFACDQDEASPTANGGKLNQPRRRTPARSLPLALGGGLTISGGEPLLQVGAVTTLAAALQAAGVSIALETAGHVPGPHVDAVLPYVDHWLFDIKTVNPSAINEQVGGDAMRPLRNLHRICSQAHAATSITVRIPLIAAFNDNL